MTNITPQSLPSYLRWGPDFEKRILTFRKEDGTETEVAFPENYPNFIQNPEFLEEKGIKTWGNLLNFLNELGFNQEVFNTLSEWTGFTDGKYVLKRGSHVTANSKVLLYRELDSTSSSGLFLEDEEPEFIYEFYETYPRPAIFYTKKVESVVQVNRSERWLYQENGYNFIPNYIYRSEKKEGSVLYLGLELEVSSRLTPAEMQYVATHVEPKQEPFFYMKHDGSVSGAFPLCYEIVTFPCSPRYMKKAFRIFFQKLENLVSQKGQKVEDYVDIRPNASNGLHIHVDRRSFRRKGHRTRFGSVWNQWDKTNQEFLQQLSRRSRPIGGSQYFDVHPRLRDKTLNYRIRHGAECLDRQDRYSTARETSSTVEVRLFQGIFDLRHIIYCIEVVRAMHKFSGEMSLRDFGSTFPEKFKSWLENQNGFIAAKKGIL